MKKAFLTLGAILVFGIASAQAGAKTAPGTTLNQTGQTNPQMQDKAISKTVTNAAATTAEPSANSTTATMSPSPSLGTATTPAATSPGTTTPSVAAPSAPATTTGSGTSSAATSTVKKQ
jgi:hypothetical protein